MLDVGCGNGRLLHELGLFRKINAHGIDIVAPHSPYADVPITTFDGQRLLFPTNSFDVVLICYVLHYLTRDHAKRLLEDALRVARGHLVLIEDTLPAFGLLYQLRNRFHRKFSDLHYGTSGGSYCSSGNEEMFLTFGEWEMLLRSLPGVCEVNIYPLETISKYSHHTMIAIRCGGSSGTEAAGLPVHG